MIDSQEYPFYCYRLPYGEELVMGIQQNPVIAPFHGFAGKKAASGFLIAPFSCEDETPALFIREDFRFTGKAAEEELKRRIQSVCLEKTGQEVFDYEQTREEYLKAVSCLVCTLKENERLKKVVYSRVITLKDASGEHFKRFQTLVARYPGVFVYCFYLPGQALWMGATPEVFLQVQPGLLLTEALAGTKKTDDAQWREKEYKEQEYVSRFIREVLDACSLHNWTEDGTAPVIAGACAHLRTGFSVRTDLPGRELEHLIRLLHPTPAVCGYPQKEAMTEILKRERHDRQFYSGFLGPVFAENRMELFVNLRCMKIAKEMVCLFVGSGITGDSDPQEEWDETALKAQTLTKVIDNIKIDL